ncbi:MAG: aminoglycoside phosphotransferase family protein [Armatimonadota bacterium]
MAENLDRTVLMNIISKKFDIPMRQVVLDRVSTGKFNTTYFVKGYSEPLVLRVAPPDNAGFVFYEKKMMAQEPQIHKLVLENTSVPVPKIYLYDDSRELIDRDYIIMQRLDGIALTNYRCTLPEYYRILEQIGKYLCEIHDITSKKYGYLGAHKPMEPADDWASAFNIMWNKMIDDIVNAGYYSAIEESMMRRKLYENYSHFDRPVVSRLLHMDVWNQNILVNMDGKVTGLIDFDRALWGDIEIEFAVLDYCGISEAPFWRGYGMQRDLSDSAKIRRLFYLLYEIQKYIIIRHYRDKDPNSAQSYKAEVLRMINSI